MLITLDPANEEWGDSRQLKKYEVPDANYLENVIHCAAKIPLIRYVPAAANAVGY